MLLDALADQGLDGVRWTRPAGGFFTWVTVDGVDPATDLLAAAIEHELIVVPGSSCFVEAPGEGAVRLAYSNGSPESLREGARRVAEVVKSLRSE